MGRIRWEGFSFCGCGCGIEQCLHFAPGEIGLQPRSLAPPEDGSARDDAESWQPVKPRLAGDLAGCVFHRAAPIHGHLTFPKYLRNITPL
jgi:hypothetical protein